MYQCTNNGINYSFSFILSLLPVLGTTVQTRPWHYSDSYYQVRQAYCSMQELHMDYLISQHRPEVGIIIPIVTDNEI